MKLAEHFPFSSCLWGESLAMKLAEHFPFSSCLWGESLAMKLAERFPFSSCLWGEEPGNEHGLTQERVMERGGLGGGGV